MASFQFPSDPKENDTVVNSLTGSTYQWKTPPGKWVVTFQEKQISEVIWEGDSPPDPIGEFRLWYSTDTLELYYYFIDGNGVAAWLPTAKPITLLKEIEDSIVVQTNRIDNLVAEIANLKLTVFGNT